MANAKSKTYKVQLDAIRLKLWELDEKVSQGEELTSHEDRFYDALEEAEKRILQSWRMFRTKVVDDMAEAKARYEAVFPSAVRDWQKAQMVDRLQEAMSTEEKGFVTSIRVVPGGEVVIDIVSLEMDGAVIAYRQSDDGQDGDWQLGGIEDAVEEALGVREQLTGLKEELAEIMAALAEMAAQAQGKNQ
jgi:hypothetical protein